MLKRLRELGAERNKLLAELERSLAIQSLWPDVFKVGKCSSCWHGRPISRKMSAQGTEITYALVLRVTSAAGEVRNYPQSDVPAVLWPCATLGKLP